METETGKFNKIKSLTVTLAVAFLSLSLVTLLLSSSLELYYSFQTQQQTISKEQNLVAQNAADTVKNYIQEKSSILNTATHLTGLVTVGQLDQKDILDKMLGFDRAFRQLVILNPQNQEQVSVSRLSGFASEKLTEKLDEATLNTFKQGKETISQVYIDSATSEPMVMIAAPVTNVFGDFQGTLIAEVNLKFMWDLVGSLKIGEKGQAYVVDKKGNLIAYSDISRILKGENLNHLPEVAEFVSGSLETNNYQIKVSKGINGNTVVTTHVPLGIPDWAIVAELPITEAYETVIYQLEYTAIIIIFAIILTVIIGLILSKKITQPIVNLRDAAKKIREGNLDTRIDIKSHDEIGELANSFNQMAQKLSVYTRELETKVQERTVALEASKKDLELKLIELEKMNKLMVGRELKMIELKKEIEALQQNSGSLL